MTLPNGMAGIGDAISTAFAITGDQTLISGWAKSTISGLPDLTQTFVTDLMKNNVVQLSPGWNGSTAGLWSGLRRGNPIDGAVPIPLAIVEQFVSQLLGLPPGTWDTIEDALEAIADLPGIAQVIKILTAIADPDNYEEVFTTWATNLQAFFANIDLNDPDLDILDALHDWVIDNIIPLIELAVADITGLADALAALAPIEDIVAALGGTGNTLGDLADALANIPGANIISVAASIITGVLSTGNVPALDFSKITSGQLSAARATWVAPIDTLMNAWDIPGTGFGISDLLARAQNIPNTKVIGELGPATIGEALKALTDAAHQGATGGTGTGIGLGQLSNALASLLGIATSGQAIANNTAAALVGRAVQKPSYKALDKTADATFDLLPTMPGTAATFVPVTATTSAMSVVDIADGGVKQSVQWYGQSTTGITSMILNLWSVNQTTGVFSKLYSSTNIIGLVSNGLTRNSHNMPSGNWVTTLPGESYFWEMQVLGTGTYQIAGIANHWASANTAVYPSAWGAYRTTPAPVFDAASNSGTVNSWAPHTHTATAGATVLAFVRNTVAPTTVTYGGVTMTYLGTAVTIASSTNVRVYALQNVAGGAKTVTQTGGTVSYLASVSYTGVGAIGTPVVAGSGATSSSLALTLPSAATTQIGVVMFSTSGTGNPLTALTAGTNRTSDTQTYTFLGDGPGATSINFTAHSNTSAQWGGIGVTLGGVVPAAPSTFTPGTTANTGYSSNVPWFAFSGVAGVSEHSPDTVAFLTAGAGQTYTVPAWMQPGDKFDIVVLSGGGGGNNVFAAPGGMGGNWTTITLIYGTNVPLGTTTFSVTVGGGGNGGNPGNPTGTNGGTSSVTISVYGTITATGGVASANNSGNPNWGGNSFYGASPGNKLFDGIQYFGGGVATVPSQDGLVPGGGGGSWGTGGGGGSGARGAVWITARQT